MNTIYLIKNGFSKNIWYKLCHSSTITFLAIWIHPQFDVCIDAKINPLIKLVLIHLNWPITLSSTFFTKFQIPNSQNSIKLEHSNDNSNSFY